MGAVGMQVNLKLFAPEPNRRKTVLLFVIRDKSKTPLPKLVEVLSDDVRKMWDTISKPPQYADSTIDDFFEVCCFRFTSQDCLHCQLLATGAGASSTHSIWLLAALGPYNIKQPCCYRPRLPVLPTIYWVVYEASCGSLLSRHAATNDLASLALCYVGAIYCSAALRG